MLLLWVSCFIYLCIYLSFLEKGKKVLLCVPGTLLSGGESLNTILDMFSTMIQSGKDVFIDQNTKLKVYTFNPPNTVGSGHTLFFTANLTEFLKKSKSIVEIKSSMEGNIFFNFCFHSWSSSTERRYRSERSLQEVSETCPASWW